MGLNSDPGGQQGKCLVAQGDRWCNWLPDCDKYGGHLSMIMFAVSLFVWELTTFSRCLGYGLDVPAT